MKKHNIEINYKNWYIKYRNDTCINPNPLINYPIKCNCKECKELDFQKSLFSILFSFFLLFLCFLLWFIIDFINNLFSNL